MPVSVSKDKLAIDEWRFNPAWKSISITNLNAPHPPVDDYSSTRLNLVGPVLPTLEGRKYAKLPPRISQKCAKLRKYQNRVKLRRKVLRVFCWSRYFWIFLQFWTRTTKLELCLAAYTWMESAVFFHDSIDNKCLGITRKCRLVRCYAFFAAAKPCSLLTPRGLFFFFFIVDSCCHNTGWRLCTDMLTNTMIDALIKRRKAIPDFLRNIRSYYLESLIQCSVPSLNSRGQFQTFSKTYASVTTGKTVVVKNNVMPSIHVLCHSSSTTGPFWP